ncbi:hypothetical protein, partial [Pseudoalteromonas sp. GABNS16H]|uniref:hypothetical protein n=1 Tax=Pseudoalteromonas sp. GABNS16H TaxID=3025325 RepID=UPI00235E2590
PNLSTESRYPQRFIFFLFFISGLLLISRSGLPHAGKPRAENPNAVWISFTTMKINQLGQRNSSAYLSTEEHSPSPCTLKKGNHERSSRKVNCAEIAMTLQKTTIATG